MHLTTYLPVALSVGKNSFELKTNGTENDEKSNGGLIIKTAFFNPTNGITFSIGVEHRGLLIAKFRSLAYGLTRWDINVPSSIKDGVINIFVEAKSINVNARLNLPSRFDTRLILVEFSAEVTRTAFDLRSYLIPACEQVARELGLEGDYMSEAGSAAMIAEIKSALSEGRGFSVVRLGDGEGRVLAQDGFFSETELLHQTLSYHFGSISSESLKTTHGQNWIRDTVRELRVLLEEAVADADFLGLPVVEYFRTAREKIVSGHYGYVAALTSGLSINPHRKKPTIVGTNCFQLAALERTFFPTILSSAKSFSIVGPWDLRPQLQAAIESINPGHFVEVQQHFSFRDEKSWGQYPIHWRASMAKIEALGDLRGQIVLVAAGLLGKHYCFKIKSQGGVALDIGSVLDSWAKRGRNDAVSASHTISIDKLRSRK